MTPDLYGRPPCSRAAFWSRRLGRPVDDGEADLLTSRLMDYMTTLIEWKRGTGKTSAVLGPRPTRRLAIPERTTLDESVVGWLREAGGRGLSRTEIRDRSGCRAGLTREIGSALERLRAAGLAEVTVVPTAGRPKRVWRARSPRGLEKPFGRPNG